MGQVIHYGELPTGALGETEAVPPPADWTSVSLSQGTFQRSDLVEGEWIWTTGTWPWVPKLPCEGVALDADGEPLEY